VPEQPDDPQSEPGAEPQSSDSPPPICIWVPYQNESLDRAFENSRPDDPDAYLAHRECRDPDVDCNSVDDCVYGTPGLIPTGIGWQVPGGGAPDIVALVDGVMVELEGEMAQPSVVMNPANRSIVNIPTFVHVENWTGTITAEQCDGDYCINAVAEPRMIFDPGEPGVEPIDCQGPGQPYDRNHPTAGDDAFVQADLPETCTHTYETATDGDATFPASVTVIWDITWTPADVAGTPSVELTEEIPRNVNEVHSVVTD
jgi:hypothetical protein